MDYQADVRIDPEQLDVEWLRQAALYARYADLSVEANHHLRQADQKLKMIKSQLTLEAAENGVNGKDKPTAAVVEAFYRIISTSGKTEFMEIDVEKMSLNDRINEIMGKLTARKKLTFAELLGDPSNKRMILYSFLAILELMRLRMIRVYQASPFGVIRVSLAGEA